MKRTVVIAFLIGLFMPVFSSAHCEIPCGIYGDEMRFDLMVEHIATMEKSMTMIKTLSTEKNIDYNQLIRWVNNKELHANYLQEIVSQYFLTQRVKPAGPDDPARLSIYRQQLELCHRLLLLAMKAKQSTDNDIIHQLLTTLDEFWGVYFGPEKQRHSH